MHEPFFTLAGFFAICGIYVAGAWGANRRTGWLGKLALWLGCSLVYGYVAYRWTCSQALTCDVGGSSPYFMTGNPRYFLMYVPLFAFIGLTTFGSTSLFIGYRFRTQKAAGLWPRTFGLGILAAVAGWVLGMGIIGAARLLGAAV